MAKEKNDDARRAILREWDTWVKNNPTDGALKGMEFFNYIRNERSELLKVGHRGQVADHSRMAVARWPG